MEDLNNVFGGDNLDNLRDATDFSRQLVSNVKELYDLNKRESKGLFIEFSKATNLLSRNLDKISVNYEKYLRFEVTAKDVKSQIKKLDENLNRLTLERQTLENKVLKDQEDQLSIDQKVKDKAQKAYEKANSVNRDMRREALTDAKEQLKLSNSKVLSLREAIDTSKAVEKSSKDQLGILTQYSKVLESSSLKLTTIRKIITATSKIPLIGPFIDANKGLEQLQKSALLGDGFWKSLGSSMSAAFGSISKVAVWLLAIEAVVKIFNFMKEAMLGADKQLTSIARSMNITKEAAQDLRKQFIGISQDVALLSEKEVYETWSSINDQLNTAVKLDAIFLEDMSKASKLIGLSSEAMNGLTLHTQAGEKSGEKIIKNIVTTNNLQTIQGKSIISNNKLLEATLKTTGYIVSAFKGIPEAIAKGVAQAHALGTSLDKINSIADGFLDFESSISAELEAQLLTGRNINLDQARYFAMTNNISGLMGEIQKNFPSWEEFNSLNRIQAEGYAKSLGMSKDEMSTMIFQQQTLNKLRTGGLSSQLTAEQKLKVNQMQSAQEAYDYLLKQKVAEEDIANLLGKRAYENLQILSAEDKFGKAMEKLKEAFTNIFTGEMIDKLADSLVGLTNSLNQGIGGLFNLGENIQKARLDRKIGDFDKIGQEEFEKIKAESKFSWSEVFKESALKSLIPLGGGNLISSKSSEKYSEEDIDKILDKQQARNTNKAHDFISRGGQITNFDKDDLIIGGSNLNNGNNNSQNIDQLKELNQNLKTLIAAVKDGKSIEMDGYQVGTAVSIGSVRVQ